MSMFLNLFFFLSSGKQSLRVREHKVLGPYVDGLSRLAVASYKVNIFILDFSILKQIKLLLWFIDMLPLLLLNPCHHSEQCVGVQQTQK